MEHIKLFEAYVFEAANSEFLESPQSEDSTTVADYLVTVKGEDKNSKEKNAKYYEACKKFSDSLSGKIMRIPKYGMVNKPTFKMEGFADCNFSTMIQTKGAGVWNYAKRKEVSQLESGYFPEVFIAGAVTKDREYADFDFNADTDGVKKQLGDQLLSGHYCYLMVYKRIGKNIELKTGPEKFTLRELVSVDPQWKSYFQGLIDLASGFE